MSAEITIESVPAPQKPRSLVIGCGYTGLPLALRLHAGGHEVTGWVQSVESAQKLAGQPLHRVITGSVANNKLWEAIEQPFDLIVHCASTGGGGESAYEQVYLKGALMMTEHQSRARHLFVSSTSVYGQADGEVVTEESIAAPESPTARILRVAEKVVLDANGTVARSSGIYGPDRSALWQKFLRGAAVIEGDGQRWINQIHQVDLVHALTHLIQAGAFGELYNVSDNEPVALLDFYTWCAEYLDKPLPPHGPVDLKRKRGRTDKRVSNAKLRATGWAPLYSSFREGLAAQTMSV